METLRDRRRQRRLAATRPAMDKAAFVEQMVAMGVQTDPAHWFWERMSPYYFRPLTPYPNDRIYGDMKIDRDDISEIALDFEKRFGGWFGENPVDCPPDPTIAELALSLQKAAF